MKSSNVIGITGSESKADADRRQVLRTHMGDKELFNEILSCHRSELSLQEKYIRLYSLLDRICKEQTASYETDFSNLFSRLHYLCERLGYDSKRIDIFRLHGRRAQYEQHPDADNYPYDLKALCEFVSFLYDTPIPPSLSAELPSQWRPLPSRQPQGKCCKRMRVVVVRWDKTYLYAYDESQPADEAFPVSCPKAFADLPDLLFEGAQLNLLDVRTEDSGVRYPGSIVFEPDYLVDVSALAACYTNYGTSPLQYLVNKLIPRDVTHHILLGNAANQFLDDCINESPDTPATFICSIRKTFRQYVLEYCACNDIRAEYFTRAETQFNHIRHIVRHTFASDTYRINKETAMLEPSFVCESLGLQGRMDLLQTDGSNLIELKSGKADEYDNRRTPKESHRIQMALYKEILHYNLDLPRDNVHAYLFYSAYPQLFLERSSKAQIQHALNLRNHIVANEIRIKQGESKTLFEQLTTEALNQRHDTSRLWLNWQRPRLEQDLLPFRQMDALEAAYFHQLLTFVTKEHFLAKTGDAQIDNSRGFANLWNSDLATKQANGNILIGLRLTHIDPPDGIEQLTFEIPAYNETFLPNFRQGDTIILYPREHTSDLATHHHIFRATIETIEGTRLTLKLRNKQRNRQLFDNQTDYAIEHDLMDSSFNQQYQGLYTFLTAPRHRRQLILGQRQPQTDPDRQLTLHHPDPQVSQIVLRMKQARDYFLLVGPPGTGKTSITLRSIVEELHADPTHHLLLLSYTNRAVDEICETLDTLPGQPAYIRIGNPQACHPRFRHKLLDRLIDEHCTRQTFRQTLAHTRIIVGTTSSVAGKRDLFTLKHFHTAIVDEASQILEPQLLGILCAHTDKGQCAIDRFILIGDHKQLPAVVQQSEKASQVTDQSLIRIGLTNCRNSLFERLHHLQQQTDSPQCATLTKQGRMHPDICLFANQYFYGGQLDIVPLPHQIEPLEYTRFPDARQDPLTHFVATHRTGLFPSQQPPAGQPNKLNRQEARIAADLVASIYRLCRLNNLPFNPQKRIGIIVPFRNQISMMRHSLRKLNLPDTDQITIDTVERYQGSQRDIIIYSTTISQPYQLAILSVTSRDGTLTIDRKLNVAITRARKQLFVTANPDLLAQSPVYRAFLHTLTPYPHPTTDADSRQSAATQAPPGQPESPTPKKTGYDLW